MEDTRSSVGGGRGGGRTPESKSKRGREYEGRGEGERVGPGSYPAVDEETRQIRTGGERCNQS